MCSGSDVRIPESLSRFADGARAAAVYTALNAVPIHFNVELEKKLSGKGLFLDGPEDALCPF